MQKIELTISPNYVPNWTIVDAIRELFQNAIDQESQHPGNTMGWEYDNTEQKLYITNKTSVLTAQTLLLGQTSKANDESTIGQFGEGYKIATLVLLRNGKQITFYNYGAKEIWRPRFVKSRRFGTDILTFFVEKVSMWSRVPDSDLTIEVSGINEDEFWSQIAPSNLYIYEDCYKVLEETEYGDVIDMPGKVFVKGLFVCDYSPYKYGYNFKPGYLRLDRDRKMASDFDLRWVASKLWSSTKSNRVLELVEEGAADVAYLNDVYGNLNYWRDTVVRRFIDVYGPEAIPVSTQDELDLVPKGYKGIVVPSSYSSLLRSRIDIPELPDPDSPKTRLQELFNDLVMRYDISAEDVDAFNEILEEI